jgi:hypothetical protein
VDRAAGLEAVALAEDGRHDTKVSAPVGSTTTTSVGIVPRWVPSTSTRCSGRVPKITGCASLPVVLAGAPTRVPSASSTCTAPFARRSVPGRKFIAGEPMKPATNRLAGWS